MNKMNEYFDDIGVGRPVCAMYVGLPGVGKSTFREGIMADEGMVILSTDDWIETAAAQEGTTYDAIWQRDIKKAEGAMRADFAHAIDVGADIIIDRTNLSAKKRRSIIAQLPANYYNMVFVFQTPPEGVWMQRLQARSGKLIPPLVLDSMQDNFVIPTLEEGWDMICKVPAT